MKNLAFLFFALFSLSICFSSCGDDDKGDPDMPEFTIIPGQGINNLKIGDLGRKVETNRL